MSEYPPGTFPIVFESGVLRFDEEGVLYIHISHTPTSPHPMETHPEGGEGSIPTEIKEASILGGAKQIGVHLHLQESDTLPEGMVFTIKGYELLRQETSGDLSIMLRDVQDPPSWFSPGKVHRFAGPDEGVRIWKDSAAMPKAPRTLAPCWWSALTR